jgi:hypothetical protein
MGRFPKASLANPGKRLNIFLPLSTKEEHFAYFQSIYSRACTPMVLSPQGSRMGSRMGTPMADSRPRTTQGVNLNATFQVRFPGDSSLYEFKSWDEVDKEFKRRGYDPRHANIHSNKSETRSHVQKDRSRILTSYGDMSTTIKQLASEGVCMQEFDSIK